MQVYIVDICAKQVKLCPRIEILSVEPTMSSIFFNSCLMMYMYIHTTPYSILLPPSPPHRTWDLMSLTLVTTFPIMRDLHSLLGMILVFSSGLKYVCMDSYTVRVCNNFVRSIRTRTFHIIECTHTYDHTI